MCFEESNFLTVDMAEMCRHFGGWEKGIENPYNFPKRFDQCSNLMALIRLKYNRWQQVSLADDDDVDELLEF